MRNYCNWIIIDRNLVCKCHSVWGGNLDLPRQISSSPGRQRWFQALPEEGRPSKRLKTHFTWFLGSKNIFGEKNVENKFWDFFKISIFFSKFQCFSQNFEKLFFWNKIFEMKKLFFIFIFSCSLAKIAPRKSFLKLSEHYFGVSSYFEKTISCSCLQFENLD